MKLTSLEKAAETYSIRWRLIKGKSYRETLWFLGTQRFWVRYRYIYLLGHRIWWEMMTSARSKWSKVYVTDRNAGKTQSQGRSIASFSSKMLGCLTTYKKWTTFKSQVHREPTYFLGVYGTMVVQMWNDGTLGIQLWKQNSDVTCFSVPGDWGQKCHLSHDVRTWSHKRIAMLISY